MTKVRLFATCLNCFAGLHIHQFAFSQGTIIIDNVNVISMVTERLDRGKTVVIRDGKISQIIEAGNLKKVL